MTGRKLPLLSIIPFTAGLVLPTTGMADGAFLKTADTLNEETRGYCLDVAGRTPNINVDGPLRVHSCKYGEDTTDQMFEWLGDGKIGAPELSRCLATEALTAGSDLYINECEDVAAQAWTISPRGAVSPRSRPDLCVTIDSEYRLAGTPPWITPVYHAREASLEACAESAQARQQFRWGEVDELERSYADTLGRQMPADLAAAIREIVSRGAGSQETAGLYATQPRLYEPDEIEVAENLAYGPHDRHRLDVHTARYRNSDAPMPVVMYFHGGGFVRGNRHSSRNVSDYFASLGLVGVNATYRLAPESKWPAGSEDVGAAVAWVKENVREYGGDPSQVFVIGKSAAAFHVAEYAFRPEIHGADVPAANGVILVSGTYSADTTNPSQGRLDYFGEDLSRWPEISILGNITRTDIPVLATVSEYDSANTKSSFANLIQELTVEHNEMPRALQLIGHDHYSPNPSVGTQDTQLSEEILQLIRSTAGAYQPMTAR